MKGKELPLTALLGLLATFTIWIIVIVTQPYSRWTGFGWMTIGFLVYFSYRKTRHLPVVKAPARMPEEEPVFKLPAGLKAGRRG